MTIKEWLVKLKQWLALITVEPTMVLYMMAFMITNIIEQAFYVNKACRVNKNFNATICDNIALKENEEYNKQVQVVVSEFHQWNDIAGHAGQIILAFFMGAWSDKRGRKIPLLMGLVGKLYFSTMVVVNSLKPTWPVEYIIYTATLPMTFTGADVAIFAAVFSYLSDVTSSESRTLRVTILEVCYLATMPTGIALGSYLFNYVTNKSYTIMFTINASLLAISIIYSLIRLKWRTNDQQRPLSEAKNLVTDFFDYKHVVETFKTVFRKRLFNHRTYLLLLILAMANYTFQRDERQMSYLYFQLKLNWSEKQVSWFRTYQSALQDVLLLTAIPLMSKLLGWRDTIIVIIGAIAHCTARGFYISAEVEWLIYVGGAFASLGPVVAPIIRSVVSKLVSVAERGKAFSILSAADNAVPIVSGIIYNQVYKHTIHTHPAGMFYVTIASQLIVLAIFTFIHFTSTERSLLCKELESNESSEIEEEEDEEEEEEQEKNGSKSSSL